MSERDQTPTPSQPIKDGGVKQPDPSPSSDRGLSKTGGGVVRDDHHVQDVERQEIPGDREGGMIGEG